MLKDYDFMSEEDFKNIIAHEVSSLYEENDCDSILPKQMKNQAIDEAYRFSLSDVRDFGYVEICGIMVMTTKVI